MTPQLQPSVALPVSAPGKPSSIPVLTGEEAAGLLDDLIAAYSRTSVQRKLQALWLAAEGDEHNWFRLRQEVTLPTQGPVISRYGFEASRAGWAQCMHFFSGMLDAGDPEISTRHKTLCYLLEPGLQQECGPEGKPLILVDRRSPDRCVLEGVSRLIEGKPRARLALASHRGLGITTTDRRFQYGHWSVCELLCGPEYQAMEVHYDGSLITHSDGDMVFNVDNEEMFEGSRLHLVSGDGTKGARTRDKWPGRVFTVNADGTISVTAAPDLVIGVEVPFHPPVPLPITVLEDNVCGEGQIWAVIGGGGQGGLIVKMGQSLKSQELAARLQTGTRVEQLRRVGDRLHYRRIRGDGPDYGWVSLTYKDTPLLIKVKGQGLRKFTLVATGRSSSHHEERDSWWWSAVVWQGRPLRQPPADGLGVLEDPSLQVCMVQTQASPLAAQASELSQNAFGLDLVRGLGSSVADEKFQVCALAREDRLLGFVLFGQLSEKPEMHVHHLAVVEAERRQGHGRRLLEHVRQLCAKRGLEWILAECRYHNLPYYYNLGFEIQGTRRAWKKGLPAPSAETSLFKMRLNSSWYLRPPAEPGGAAQRAD